MRCCKPALGASLLTLVLLVFPVRAAEINGNLVVHGTINSCVDAGSTDAYACALPHAIPDYNLDAQYGFRAATSNTGAASINFNSVGAVAIKKWVGGAKADLVDNDIRAGQWVGLIFDGTDMVLVPSQGTMTIASGSLALGTASIASGACSTPPQTLTGQGILATDTVLATFNADVTTLTGYAPVTTGSIYVVIWPTANTINLRQCNPTATALSPQAATVNLRVLR